MSPRLVHVLTVADSLVFIDTVVRRATERGFEVTVITSPDERLEAFGRRLGVRTVPLEMPRRVSPLRDGLALSALHRQLVRLQPDVVHAGTPKGGLLGMLAARACEVPVRLYQMRGLAYVTARGPLRTVLQATERLSCGAATRIICQSRSLHAQALSEGLVSPARSEVVLEGSNGVDALGRFEPTQHREAGRALRRRFGIGDDEVVFGFVGRLVRDKGVPELMEAFERLCGLPGPKPRLLIAGPFEPRDPVSADVKARLEQHPQVHLLGAVSEAAPVYAASDVVVLPSHREGFPNVPLEAAAMGLPVITTRVPGCVDAVVEGVTGTLVGVDDPAALCAAMDRLRSDLGLRARLGEAGLLRARASFSRERVADAMVDLYVREMTSN